MEKRKRGKPLKLTHAVIERVADHLRTGGSRRGAATTVTVDERTFRRWNKKGREGFGGMYRELWNAVVAAEEEFRAPKPKPRPRVIERIIEATIREEKDGQRLRPTVNLTFDDYEALRRACTDVKAFMAFKGQLNGLTYRPREEDCLTAQQRYWVDHLLEVTLCDSLERRTRAEFRPAQEQSGDDD
jgi:hypothetical protein